MRSAMICREFNAALPDQDEIIGAYFCGQLPPRTNASFPWASAGTCVERLIQTKPDLFKAAVVNEDANRAMTQARDSSAGSPATDPATVARDECINNLRGIDGAKQQWAIVMGKRAEDTPAWSDIQSYIGPAPAGAMPQCPSGGTYTIGTLGARPECSIAGHVCP
jgi:hypothetical protein